MHRSALLGQSLTWRSLGRSLLANAMRVRRNWMLQPGGGGCSIQRPHRAIIIRKNKSL